MTFILLLRRASVIFLVNRPAIAKGSEHEDTKDPEAIERRPRADWDRGGLPPSSLLRDLRASFVFFVFCRTSRFRSRPGGTRFSRSLRHASALWLAALFSTGLAPVAASGPESSGWRPALPGYRFAFPRDHANHPAFHTEWWYYTGHLRAGEGRTFGFELTFFRFGIRPPGTASRSAWTLRNLYAAHFAVTDEARQRFFSADRASRGALGMAGAASDRYHVWIEDWSSSLQLFKRSNSGPSAGIHRLRAAAGGYRLELDLQSAKPPAIHGRNGVSQKAAGRGRASHYYSLTRLQGGGTLVTPEGRFPVEALAWMDHEFGSNQLAPDQVGWDWFSLQLDDGRDLMLYQLRRRDGRPEPFSSGTLVERDGRTHPLRLQDFHVTALAHWRSPKTGGLYPSRWRVQVPAAHLDLTLAPTLADQ